MKVGYDPAKNSWNIQTRGLSFEDAALLDWTNAQVRPVKRHDYGEDRYQAFVEDRDEKPFVVVFTVRAEVFWIISFPRAHDKERKRMSKPDPTMMDEENPEWTAQSAAEARPFGDMFPEQFKVLKNKGGRPPAEQPKVHIGFRLAADVVDGVRASGPGYNARVEKVLRDALARNKV